jgi:UDP-glucose 4-epimerase
MVKILITGGAGFIGSHLAIRLAQADHEVVVIDNLDPYYSVELKKKNLKLVTSNNNTSFINCDILSYPDLNSIIEDGIEYIFHEAAQPGVRASIEDPMKPLNVNIHGTLNILQSAIDNDVKKVINASSSSVYGKVEHLPFQETHPTHPLSPYGVSKLAAEHYCRVFTQIYGIPTVSIRYFTVYGPRMRPDLAIPIFTQNLLENQPPEIFGDGDQTRDFTFVDDIITANEKLLDSSALDGEVVNIGSGNRITINKLLAIMKALLNSDAEPVYSDRVKGDALHTLADIARARDLIGYEPTTTIENGIEKFIEWYRANPDFYIG